MLVVNQLERLGTEIENLKVGIANANQLIGRIEGELRGIRTTLDDRAVSRDKIEAKLGMAELLVNTLQAQVVELQRVAKGEADKTGVGIMASLTDFRIVIILMGIGALLGKRVIEQLSGMLN